MVKFSVEVLLNYELQVTSYELRITSYGLKITDYETLFPLYLNNKTTLVAMNYIMCHTTLFHC